MTAVLFLLRVVVLVLLWGFVIAAIVAVRHDVFGTRRKPAPTTRSAPAPKTRPQPQPKAKPKRSAAAAQPESSNARRLVVTEGNLAGQSFPLSDTALTIGRAPDSTLVLSDDYVSTRHARLVRNGSAWVLEDLGSTNGTYLDRQRISAPTPVPIGIPIRVGKTVMELRQ